MNRSRVITPLLVAAALLSATLLAVGEPAQADSSRPRQVAVVIADGPSVRDTEGASELVISFVGLLATLQSDRLVAFINMDDPSDVLGPFLASDPNLIGMRDEIERRLLSPYTQRGGDLVDALQEAQVVLGNERAEAGSTAYVITGSMPTADNGGLAGRMPFVTAQFNNKGWSINGVGLDGTSRATRELLYEISSGTGGESFELSIPDGFQRLANAMLSEEASGSLTELGSRVLTRSQLMSSTVGVVPGTAETTILLFRENPYGSLRLRNPSGFEASAGDRAVSNVVETPHVVVWSLVDPVPGDWRIDSQGVDGHISAWSNSTNGYSIVLQSLAPVALGKPASLTAHVDQRGEPVALEGVRMFADITGPDGTTMVHQLKDDGSSGDGTAGDGQFTVVLPPLAVEGIYQLAIELFWVEYTHRIFSHATFEARAFPALDVTSVQVEGLEPGERTRVATVSVHVQGQPYPVTPEQLTAAVSSPSDRAAYLEIEPRLLFGDGPSWEYDVYLTATENGHHAVALTLRTDYAGRLHSFTTEPIAVSTVPPPAPVGPTAGYIPVVAAPSVASIAPVAPPAPPAPAAAEPSSVPLWAPIAVIVVLTVLAAVLVYLFTRTRPYGYLYDDMYQPLADFAKTRRHPVLAFLFRSSVKGRDLGIPELEGVVFHFGKARIRIQSMREHPTIRVNNQPLVGQASLHHRTWLGTRGKLYTFMLTPTLQEGEASAD